MKRLELTQEEKNLLLKEYPFLQVRSSDTDIPIEGLNYIDDVPNGWLNLFKEFLPKLKAKLIEHNLFEEYRVTQIKEKFGYVHFYDNCIHPEIIKLIHEFELATENTCIICGEPATYRSLGWISPYCTECKEHLETKMIKDGLEKSFSKIEK